MLGGSLEYGLIAQKVYMGNYSQAIFRRLSKYQPVVGNSLEGPRQGSVKIGSVLDLVYIYGDQSMRDDNQGAQYPLIKEYGLNHIRGTLVPFRVYSLIKKYWAPNPKP